MPLDFMVGKVGVIFMGVHHLTKRRIIYSRHLTGTQVCFPLRHG